MKKIIGYLFLGIGLLMTLGVFLGSVIRSIFQFSATSLGAIAALPLGVIGAGVVILLAGVLLIASTKN